MLTWSTWTNVNLVNKGYVNLDFFSPSIFTVEDTANIPQITDELISYNREEFVNVPITNHKVLYGCIAGTQWPAPSFSKYMAAETVNPQVEISHNFLNSRRVPEN